MRYWRHRRREARRRPRGGGGGGGRRRLPEDVEARLARCGADARAAERCLADAGYFVVHDAGVERLVLLRREHDDTRLTTQAIWDQSVPSFPAQYYSDNAGVAALCHAASVSLPG